MAYNSYTIERQIQRKDEPTEVSFKTRLIPAKKSCFKHKTIKQVFQQDKWFEDFFKRFLFCLVVKMC